jgi:hypothetical protein
MAGTSLSVCAIRVVAILACCWGATAAAGSAPSTLVQADRPSASEESMPARRLKIDRADVQVDFDGVDFSGGIQPLMEWIQRSGRIVTGYYGRFPVAGLRIRVVPVDGRGVPNGTTYGFATPLIRVQVGRTVTEAQLMNDWVLVHEMVHLALPEVGRAHTWLSEGLATYVESIARVQMGNRKAADVWAENMRLMPQGLPGPGDQGLDRTHTWGRTYWGGAIFCLMADVEIRSRTANKFGLRDALRAINRDSGGITGEWPIERVLETGDAAVGINVLQELYGKMKESPAPTDLAALWVKLGVESDGDTARLRDDAPLAAVRDAIMRAD